MDRSEPASQLNRRFPLGAIAACVFALAALVALGVAVARHNDSAMADMPGMHGAAQTWTRAGSGPTGTLLGSKLVTAWQLDAIALAILVLVAAWYLTCVALVGVRHPDARWPLTRTLAFVAGVLVAAYATNGAVAVFDQTLFTAHMIGHLALVMLAPALMVTGRPLRLAIESAPPARAERLRRIYTGRVVSAITCPPVALATYTVVIVGSHLTGLMDTFMRNTWAGQVEHLVYLLAGLQFFLLIVGDEPIRWKLAAPARWLLLALGMAVDTFTGIVLMQQTSPVGMLASPSVHVDPLSDTHTGGAIMWFGGDGLMAVVMVVLVLSWLRRVDTAQADEKGWLEKARVSAFTDNTGAANDPSSATFDDDDAMRASYNAWLEKLNKS